MIPLTTSTRERWQLDDLSLGISLGGVDSHASWLRMLEWVTWAESRDLHSVWLPEMHFVPGACSSPLWTLAALSARTKRLRLATTSLLLPIHHPLQVAAEIATLDRMSGGRLILGLGRGFAGALFEAFGIEARTKVARFDECLDVVMRAWAGESLDALELEYHELGEAGLSAHGPDALRPSQDPHPPLAVAAFGRKGLAQAARRGLPYLASPMEPYDLIGENLRYHREQLGGGAGDDPVVPIMRVVFVSADAACCARVSERMSGAMRPAGARLPKAMARAMEAPVEDRVIVGDVAQVIDRLAPYRENLGMNLLVVRPLIPGARDGEQEESLCRIVEEVLPALR